MAICREYQTTKYACYATNVSMSAVANLSPLLFVTFREMYGISYTLLGLLVVVNFFTQLLIDLIFTFFTKHFNIHKTVRLTPIITLCGLLLYAILPAVFPEMAYVWIAVGTVIFSVSSGLCEVLISPVIAAIPSDNPEREMSKLHSTYAWGVVAVVIISTLFLHFCGRENWRFLAILWALVPLAAAILFSRAKLPPMQVESADQKQKTRLIPRGFMLFVACIFLGGAAECTMSQWVSGFVENVLKLPKVLGDIFGMAFFAVMLGLGRTMYAKYGKRIASVMLMGMAGATICYLVAGVSLNPVVGLIACALTGICTSMLWPGTLIYAGEKFPDIGVAAYALLAAGGDFGASVAPQMVGIVADTVGASSFAQKLSNMLSIHAEQIGMRAGILTAGIFPLAGIVLLLYMKKYFCRKS